MGWRIEEMKTGVSGGLGGPYKQGRKESTTMLSCRILTVLGHPSRFHVYSGLWRHWCRLAGPGRMKNISDWRV